MRSTFAVATLLLPWTAVAQGCAGEGAADTDSGDQPMVAEAAPVQDVPPVRDAPPVQEPPPNRLTPEEEAAGWRLLFDGTLDSWRGYRRADAPGGWSARDGALAFTPGVDDGTLITAEQFGDFELALEWKIEEGGNSGVFYRATEAERAIYWTGPELQILDNAGHPDGRNPETSAGSNYALHAPSEDVTRPLGEWNQVRIVVRGASVEHWMNGVKVVGYDLWTDEWRAMVADTKFADWPGYGMARMGHIGLQDHGDPVWYRNVRIRVFRLPDGESGRSRQPAANPVSRLLASPTLLN